MNKQELEVKIYCLEKDLEVKEKEKEMEIEKIHFQEQQHRLDLSKQTASQGVLIEQLKARIAEHPYKQLTDLLKAIAVKLPTLDIKELSVKGK